MTKKIPCICPESTKPVQNRCWVIVAYRQRYVGHMSGVLGSKWVPSEDSTLSCPKCGAIWRTDDECVEQLKNRKDA